MLNIQRTVDIKVDLSQKRQVIDGFGVNINSKHWQDGKLIPTIDLLIDDLGATLFRLDAYGKSNWVDPDDLFDASVLNENTYKRVYSSKDFRYAAEMGKYLNSRGIQPYITMSGIVPKWMCEEDGKTLKDYEAFAEMAVSYAKWLKKEAGVDFRLFGPLNETDIGPPEGPAVSPVGYAKALDALIDKLDKYGLDDIRLVVAEQAYFSLEYVNEIFKSKRRAGRVEVIGMHTYSDVSHEQLAKSHKAGNYGNSRLWMTEYGDLDQTGEKEWYIGWKVFERLMRLLHEGYNGALNWDAYDNYHDHNEFWTIYGLFRTGLGVYTPKKRYYACKHIYRFAKPGSTVIDVKSPMEGLDIIAFLDPNGTDITLAGLNATAEDVFINVYYENADQLLFEKRADVYITTHELNCANVDNVAIKTKNWPYNGTVAAIPAKSIFSVTTVKK